MALPLEMQQQAPDTDSSEARATCTDRFPVHHTLLAEQSNGFLQTGGVLVRAYDGYNNRPEMVAKYIPASFLHATMRAARVIYDYEEEFPNFAVLIGSKFATRNNNNDAATVVDCSHFYPTDGNTWARGVNEDPPRCVQKPFIDQTCQMGKCLIDFDQCDKCNVAGSEVAPIIQQLVERNKRKKYTSKRPKLENLFVRQCWFEDWKEAITAANDLWLTRTEWWDPSEEVIARNVQNNLHVDYRYEGWTECRANSTAIQDPSMMDAVVITVKHAASLCEAQNQTGLSAALHVAQHAGYDNLPVLLFREAKGGTNGTNNDYCNRWWGGEHCDDSWTKEFFSQEFDFEDGSCLRRQGDSENVYFYPNCTVTSAGDVAPQSLILPRGDGGMSFDYQSLPNGCRELAMLSLLICALLRCRRVSSRATDVLDVKHK